MYMYMCVAGQAPALTQALVSMKFFMTVRISAASAAAVTDDIWRQPVAPSRVYSVFFLFIASRMWRTPPMGVSASQIIKDLYVCALMPLLRLAILTLLMAFTSAANVEYDLDQECGDKNYTITDQHTFHEIPTKQNDRLQNIKFVYIQNKGEDYRWTCAATCANTPGCVGFTTRFPKTDKFTDNCYFIDHSPGCGKVQSSQHMFHDSKVYTKCKSMDTKYNTRVKNFIAQAVITPEFQTCLAQAMLRHNFRLVP